MNITSKQFFEIAKQFLKEVKNSQRDVIVKAAELMVQCMERDGLVQLVGVAQGRAFAMELGYRAGGLMPFHQFNTTDLALRGVISEETLNDRSFNNNVEMAKKLWDLYRIEEDDMFIICDEGCLAITIETAIIAKKNGHKIIAVINKKLNNSIKSNHPSGKKLSDIADLVIDNCAPERDALLDYEKEHKINQISTINGNVIAQMITAEMYRYFIEKGIDCPVLLSANLKGADVHNRALSDKYLGRWNS